MRVQGNACVFHDYKQYQQEQKTREHAFFACHADDFCNLIYQNNFCANQCGRGEKIEPNIFKMGNIKSFPLRKVGKSLHA